MKDQTRESTRRRRHHDRGFKDDLIAQSLVPGASVAAIAMKGGVNTNLLFKWRRERSLERTQSAPATATLLPVCVIPDMASTLPAHPVVPVAHGACADSPSPRAGVIEIEIVGAQLRLRGTVDEAMLTTVLRALRQSA